MTTADRDVKYPIEPSFKASLLITAMVALAPMMAAFFWAGGQKDLSRFSTIIFGNWISPFIFWLFAATIFYLWRKKRLFIVEKRATGTLIDIYREITNNQSGEAEPQPSANDLSSALLAKEPDASPDNLLISRLKFREQSGLTGSTLTDLLAESEASAMEGSYAMAHFSVWAIPILGFIGTVWGISGAVSGFSQAMSGQSSAAGISEALKETLPLVTANLATAFDTTFLALILSLPLMYMITTLEKAENSYLKQLAEWSAQTFSGHSTAKSADFIQNSPVQSAPTQAAPMAQSPQAPVNQELSALTMQIDALRRTMQDLSQLLFALKEQEIGSPKL